MLLIIFGDGNCLFNLVFMLLVDDIIFVSFLRMLIVVELFVYLEFYVKYLYLEIFVKVVKYILLFIVVIFFSYIKVENVFSGNLNNVFKVIEILA